MNPNASTRAYMPVVITPSTFEYLDPRILHIVFVAQCCEGDQIDVDFQSTDRGHVWYSENSGPWLPVAGVAGKVTVLSVGETGEFRIGVSK